MAIKAITQQGLTIERHNTKEGIDPLTDGIEYEIRSSKITEPDGTVIFQMDNIEAPKSWSQLAIDVAASKYFKRAQVPTPEGREVSVKQMITRVSHTLRQFGEEHNYFATKEDAQAFEDELTHLLITQKGAFNSPVWFNCGLFHKYGIKGNKPGTYFYNLETDQVEECEDSYSHAQCSACQPYHALINTTKGLMPIGKIVEENLTQIKVYDGNSITKVTAVKFNGKKPVYRITLGDGHFIDVTKDHIVCAHHNRGAKKFKWKKVEDLKIGEYMRIYTNSIPEDKIINPQLESEAALAGWLQTDGFVGQYSKGRNRSLTIEFMTANNEEFDWIISHLNIALPNIHKKIRKVKAINKNLKIRRIRLYGEVLRPFVEKYELLKRKEKIRVPKIIWTSTNRTILIYLKSIFQAEGYSSMRDNSARIALAMISKEFVQDLQTLLIKLGIYSKLRLKKEKRENREDIYEIDIAIGSERKKFMEKVGFISKNKKFKAYKTLLIKNQKVCPSIKYSQISKIEPIGMMDVYDIQTESGHYLTNSILVHNCFIQKIEDSLDSIYELITNESKIFKFGSGTGSSFSSIRGTGEPLSGGGVSSGLMSYLRILDRSAAAVKSGGITRRAAKMVILDMDHPEIEDFIWWKVKEEDKVKALIKAGYSSDFNGEAYSTVSGQNSNNSVMIPDSFMQVVLDNKEWNTIERTTGKIRKTYQARDLMKQISEAAWRCADPGVMFYDQMNKWHTCPNTEPIHATNPCSEYIFIDNTACNLASINLMKFIDSESNFDIESFKYACRIFFIAQEIIVDFGSYPTKAITQRSHEFRTIGLGYANLGTLLMTEGIPYDSDKGRAISSAITALLTGHAYETSAEITRIKGPFVRFEENKEPMLKVMKQHRDAAYKLDVRYCPEYLLEAAREQWDKVVELGEKHGFRNAQATVLAPTGTISFLMDCDTTGVEPEFSLVKWKKLAGGGYFKITNKSINRALKKLNYTEEQIKEIEKYILGTGTLKNAPHVNPEALTSLGYTEEQIKETENYVNQFKTLDQYTPHINPSPLEEKGLSKEQIKEAKIYIEGAQTIEGAPHVQQKHYPIFDCANKCGIGKRFIVPMGHVKMMAAVQPFISGAISKTCNLPNEATVEDIQNIYFEAWQLGLKAIALYRDGCKLSQPLNARLDEEEVEDKNILKRGMRKKLPQKRKGFALKTNIAGHKLFIHTGEYEDHKLGEIFLDVHKEGATYRSLMNSFAIAVSLGLQYGVPLEKFVDMFTFTKFEPNGMTDHPNIKTCTSMIDFVFRVLGMEYLGRTDFVHVKPKSMDDLSLQDRDKKLETFIPKKNRQSQVDEDLAKLMGDAPACDQCGHITVRNGSCYKCLNCGNSMGCS